MYNILLDTQRGVLQTLERSEDVLHTVGETSCFSCFSNLPEPRRRWAWIGEGKLRVALDKVFPLEEAAAGHDYIVAGKTTGKVLYKV